MLETLEQRENAMRDVLRKIESKTDFKEVSDNEKKLAKECYDAKLFEGVVLEQMVSGRIIAEYRHEPRLTLKGVQFIQAKKNQKLQAKKLAEEHANEETERKKDRKYQLLAAVFSGIAASLLALFIQYFDEIISVVFALIQKLR